MLSVLKFHDDVPWYGHSVDPFGLESSLYEFWEIILLMIPSPPLSVLSQELPLFRNWTSWTLLRSYLVFYYFHLSVSLLYLLGDFLTNLSSKLLSLKILFMF